MSTNRNIEWTDRARTRASINFHTTHGGREENAERLLRWKRGCHEPTGQEEDRMVIIPIYLGALGVLVWVVMKGFE